MDDNVKKCTRKSYHIQMTAHQKDCISIYKREKFIRERVKKNQENNEKEISQKVREKVRQKSDGKLPFIFCTIVLTSGSWMP